MYFFFIFYKYFLLLLLDTMIIKIYVENNLSEVLSKLGLPPPCFRLENTDEGYLYAYIIFLYHDAKGNKIMTDKTDMSVVNIEGARYYKLLWLLWIY